MGWKRSEYKQYPGKGHYERAEMFAETLEGIKGYSYTIRDPQGGIMSRCWRAGTKLLVERYTKELVAKLNQAFNGRAAGTFNGSNTRTRIK